MFWNKQKRLNKSLIAAAREGNVRDIALLLDQGAEIEARGGKYQGTVLAHAVLKEHLPAVKLLLDRGADINAADNEGDTPLACAVLRELPAITGELLGRGANRELANHKGLTPADQAKDHNVLAALGLLPPAPTPAPAPLPRPPAPQNPDEVVLQRDFGGGRILQEIFNFPAHERISVVRHGMDGPVEAMTRENFSMIGDRATLRKAFEDYAARGGTVPENEVFPDELGKPKPAVRGL